MSYAKKARINWMPIIIGIAESITVPAGVGSLFCQEIIQ